MKLAALAATLTCLGVLGLTEPAFAAPSFDYSPQPVLTGLEIAFNPQDVGSSTVTWDFDGNGTIDPDTTGGQPSFTYMSPGTYTAKMYVEDGTGGQVIQNTIVVGQLSAPFITTPATPLAGQDVLLVYGGQTSQTAPIEHYDWELDGDNDFNDASGIVLHRIFPVAGDYVVGLRVKDKDGAFGSEFREIHVRSATVTPPSPLRLMSPFPVIRITGRVTNLGAFIRRLTAVAPIGAQVTVRCKGRGCPFKKSTRVAARAKNGSAKTTTATIRFRKMERRLLRGGTVIRVYVTRQGWIGKYTRWTIRKSKPPKRSDSCLIPGVPAPGACPGA